MFKTGAYYDWDWFQYLTNFKTDDEINCDGSTL